MPVRKCPCCGGPSNWSMNKRPTSCDECKRRCGYLLATEPCAVSGKVEAGK